MNLDLIAGALTGWLALCLFTLFIVSSPKRRSWMTIPAYVRRGFVVTGTMFMWRSVNFVSVAGSPQILLGHINAEGMMALVAMVYLITAMTWWVFTELLPRHGWDRLEWIKGVFRRRPDAVPLMLTPKEAIDVAHASGLPAVEAGAGPEAVVREAVRVAHR